MESQFKQVQNKHMSRLRQLLNEANKVIPVYLQPARSNTPESDEAPGAPEKKKSNRRFVKHSKYIRKKRKNARMKLDNIFVNLSDFKLTEAMKSLLNRHLSFSILPKHFNSTQMDVDLRRFERTMKWMQVFADEPNTQPESIFKTKKHNLPKEKPSKKLANFLYTVRAMIFGSDLKQSNTNLPPHEEQAMKQLVQAQKEGKIVIKKADKGGAIVIMNRDDYVEGMMEHINSTVEDENGDTIAAYREVDPHNVVEQRPG